MRIKPGVVLHETGPEMLRAFATADEVMLAAVGLEATTTSVREGNHSDVSLHYWRPLDPDRWPQNPAGSQGAFDLRTWRGYYNPLQLPAATKAAIAEALRLKLGPDWDVVVESDHIHCEHDPRERGETA